VYIVQCKLSVRPDCHITRDMQGVVWRVLNCVFALADSFFCDLVKLRSEGVCLKIGRGEFGDRRGWVWRSERVVVIFVKICLIFVKFCVVCWMYCESWRSQRVNLKIGEGCLEIAKGEFGDRKGKAECWIGFEKVKCVWMGFGIGCVWMGFWIGCCTQKK